MNKRQRIDAAIQKEAVDRPPIALWRHFPGDDLHPKKLADDVIEFQKRYEFDFVKVTPAASYVAEMYGGTVVDAKNREGTRNHRTRVINDWQDWRKIVAVEMDNSVILRERESIRLIRDNLEEDVPILQTLFTPLSCARTLAGERLLTDLREHPNEVKNALEQLAKTMERFAAASIDEGADALFISTQTANRDVLTPEEFRAFEEPYDLAFLDDVGGRVDFIFLHIHGDNNYFEQLFKFPVQIVNWHDRKTAPSLGEGADLFEGAVAGGIDQWDVLAAGTPAQVKAQVHDAIAQTDGMGLIIAAGCVIPIDTPAANIEAARRAVEM